jgi:hypothetical protein
LGRGRGQLGAAQHLGDRGLEALVGIGRHSLAPVGPRAGKSRRNSPQNASVAAAGLVHAIAIGRLEALWSANQASALTTNCASGRG